MGVASVVALGAALLIAGAVYEGSAEARGMTLACIGAVIAAGAALCVVPLLGPPLVTPDRWGMIVLGISGGRTLLGMGAMLILIEAFAMDRKSVVYGVLAGVTTLMIAEAVVAVLLLSQRERARDAARRAALLVGSQVAGPNADHSDSSAPQHGSLA
ncbi:MAG: hypothetical protein SFY96_04845 [Planctomycetota bacterium]|nr:hypothetical protein [Planctomycetota bacterium]